MATIKELKLEITQFLNPNITKYSFEGKTTFEINNTWIDKLPENYFFTSSLILVQHIESTCLKSSEPIFIIKEVREIFEKRISRLKNWKKESISDYLKKEHNYAIDNNLDGISKALFEKQVSRQITQENIDKSKPETTLFKIGSFVNMVKSDGVHQNEQFEYLILLYFINEFIIYLEMVKSLLDEIIEDNKNYKIVTFDDYFKSFYNDNTNKIQVKLKLKDLAYLFYFFYTSGLFKMHEDSRKNKVMLMDFFEKNFMYTDANEQPKHFKKFIKEVSDVTSDDVKHQLNFSDQLIKKIEEFKLVELYKVERQKP